MARQDLNIGTTANDGTGDSLRVAMTKIQGNTEELYSLKFGIYNYNHSGTAQSIPSNTWTHILNDGAGSNTILTNSYSDVDIYNTTTSLLDYTDLNVGDSIDNRFDANITTTSNSQDVKVRLVLDVGGLNIPLTFIDTNYKSTGTYPLFGDIRNDILSVLVRNGGARFEIYSDSSCTLDLNGWNLKVTKQTM